MSKITPEQLNIIQALHCERLTSREGNRNLVNSFKCERNPTLAEVLRNAWVIDEKGYKESYSNDVTHRVQKTFASIELENFCANDATKEKWHDLKIYNPLGVIVFLFFVLPIVEEVRKGIGCEMLYLYAADSSDDEHLVNYYRSQLNFETYNDIGSSKPTYDFLCTLMCQNIHEALRYKDAYIESFNENR